MAVNRKQFIRLLINFVIGNNIIGIPQLGNGIFSTLCNCSLYLAISTKCPTIKQSIRTVTMEKQVVGYAKLIYSIAHNLGCGKVYK